MTSQNELFYLGSGEIVKAGGGLRFKLTEDIFHDEDAAVLPREKNDELFYAHDPEYGFLVVRSEFADDNRFWYDTVEKRLVKLDKPTEKIRRIAIREAIRDNPGGPLDSVNWNFSKGKTVHYVTSEKMVQGSPKSFYILYTDQLERLMNERDLKWKREVDKNRLRKAGFNHLAANRSDDEEAKHSEGEQGLLNEENKAVDIYQTEVQIEDISPGIYSIIDLNYLLVRFGAEEVIRQDPTVSSKPDLQLQNEVYPVETDYQHQTISAKLPFRIHDKYPTQFKLFMDVSDSDRLEEVKNEFLSSPSCRSASISASFEDRIFFVLKRFDTTETPEGFVNNVVYPK